MPPAAAPPCSRGGRHPSPFLPENSRLLSESSPTPCSSSATHVRTHPWQVAWPSPHCAVSVTAEARSQTLHSMVAGSGEGVGRGW